MGSLLKNIHILIILGAFIKIGWSFYDFNEQQTVNEEKINTLTNELRRTESLKRDIKKYLSNIEAEKQKIERVAQEIEKTQQLLPSELSDTENVYLLRKIAEDVNIKEVSISPGRDEANGFYISRAYQFHAKATYLQFLILFEKISESKRILNISEVEFKKIEQPQRSKFQIIDGSFVMEAYRYNSNFKEDRGLDQLENQFKSNGQSPKTPKSNSIKKNKGEGDI